MKGDPEYTGSIQASPTKNRKQKGQTLTSPQQEPNQSKKINKERGPSTMEELAQDKRLQMNEFFNLWIDRTSFSKTILFLSFQTIQNKQRGAARQTLLRFLSFKGASQPKSVSLTENGRTQLTPNKENNRSHKTFALEQWAAIFYCFPYVKGTGLLHQWTSIREAW